MSASKNVGLSAPPTPATTEEFNKRRPHSEVSELVEEGEAGENLMEEEVSSCWAVTERLKSGKDSSALYFEVPDQLVGVENISTERETKEIEFNVTPNKRLLKKKHRPKVFKEGKHLRTPKPVTPLSDMDEKIRWKDNLSYKRKYVWRNKETDSLEKENFSCKRKYVWRHKDATYSSNTTTNVFEETVNKETMGKVKSPRRRLNFDLEEPKALEEFSGCPYNEGAARNLTGKDCDKGDEQPDVDEEKWWVEERRVFQGRVDSFIARMHLVQGDRRFSQWKGSVVDSVVGVFLTQNVSDHLSSSAFMSLAAKFPFRPKAESFCTSMEIRDRCIIPLVDHHKTERNLFDNGPFRSSLQLSVSQNADIKEINNCSETVGGITGSSVIYYCRQKGKGKGSNICKKEVFLCEESTVSRPGDFMSRKCGESEGSVTGSTSPHRTLSSSRTGTTIDSIITQTTGQITLSKMDICTKLPSFSHKNTAEGAIDVSIDDIIHAPGMTGGNHVVIEQNSVMSNTFGPSLRAEMRIFLEVSPETSNSAIKDRKSRPEVENSACDWERLRRDVCCRKPAQERNSTTMDSLDWEAVRNADVSEIAEAIRGRGMNNVLAERIKEFLNRLVKEHGSIDLEWLRDVAPDKVKDYLISIRGLGPKSVECVRLLTLQQLAFPVDTNVGRICVRLGWVPLQPLPESLQLHLLELYPMLITIQKYLWPRLCKLDQQTLYELHYQMITFGKVFCTKSKPNCNYCPMRGDCRHFASAFASARLALPAPEEKSIVCLTTPVVSEKKHGLFLNSISFPQIEGSPCSQECTFQNNCVPIIEEPASPEPECQGTLESAIEDAFYEDPDEIPFIQLNFEEFMHNLQNYMEEHMMLQDGSLSKALVALTPVATSIPMPKLKNVSRLRTEHYVYEISDSHPLLEGLDPREPDDPSPYLLAIWTPGETPQSIEPPKAICNSQGVDQPCENTCFACKETKCHMVRGTILIPCRTAMRGSFPLNGTYFQVNEVFADHHSSHDPLYVPRDWIWNLPRRTVFFGTSIPTIFRGLTTEGIQQCFWRGFVCVRGFDRVTRSPKPLYARLHFPASKATMRRDAAEPTKGGKTLQ